MYEQKFKVPCYDEAVSNNCMHAACNSRYFVRAAAVHTKKCKEKKKYAIWNAA